MTRTSTRTKRPSDSSFRRAFLVGFAMRIGDRLKEAQETATAEAGVELGTSVEVVLVKRDRMVEALLEETFPNLHSRKAKRVDAAGFDAGQAAAAEADISHRHRLRK